MFRFTSRIMKGYSHEVCLDESINISYLVMSELRGGIN